MAAHTAPAGQIYFPSGTPDLHDVKAGRVDIDGSAVRELREETGLGPGDVEFVPGMDLVLDPVRVCCMKRVRSPDTAANLVDRIHAWLEQDTKPELARMHIVRTTADIRPAMPGFVVSYLNHRLTGR
jgi:8-oxo-dGTP pyrophosphatase MutT (NUDIX family)